MGTYMAMYMKERRLKRRLKLIEYLGGSCYCGLSENLEFDHINPSEKLFDISGFNLDKPWNILLNEVKKCQLLCKNHHIEKTSKEILAKHGTISRYFHRKMPCRCKLCIISFRKYKKELYRRKKKLRML